MRLMLRGVIDGDPVSTAERVGFLLPNLNRFAAVLGKMVRWALTNLEELRLLASLSPDVPPGEAAQVVEDYLVELALSWLGALREPRG
jgi:hypothetical protein